MRNANPVQQLMPTIAKQRHSLTNRQNNNQISYPPKQPPNKDNSLFSLSRKKGKIFNPQFITAFYDNPFSHFGIFQHSIEINGETKKMAEKLEKIPFQNKKKQNN